MYGSMELFVSIMGLDIVTRFITGGGRLLYEALGYYAIDAFDLVFPEAAGTVSATVSAGPDLNAALERAVRPTAPGGMTPQTPLTFRGH